MGFYSWPCFFFLGDVNLELVIWIVGVYRVINGCPESGNSDPTGILLYSFYLGLNFNYLDFYPPSG